MADIIKSRRDTAENWRTANPTLAEGELGFETDTKRYKLGDGKTAWNSLAYFDRDVDAEPTAGSENLVKSGGVFKALKNEGEKISELERNMNDIVIPIEIHPIILDGVNIGYKTDGTMSARNVRFATVDISKRKYLYVEFDYPGLSENVNYYDWVFFGDSLDAIDKGKYNVTEGKIMIKVPDGAVSFCYTLQPSATAATSLISLYYINETDTNNSETTLLKISSQKEFNIANNSGCYNAFTGTSTNAYCRTSMAKMAVPNGVTNVSVPIFPSIFSSTLDYYNTTSPSLVFLDGDNNIISFKGFVHGEIGTRVCVSIPDNAAQIVAIYLKDEECEKISEIIGVDVPTFSQLGGMIFYNNNIEDIAKAAYDSAAVIEGEYGGHINIVDNFYTWANAKKYWNVSIAGICEKHEYFPYPCLKSRDGNNTGLSLNKAFFEDKNVKESDVEYIVYELYSQNDGTVTITINNKSYTYNVHKGYNVVRHHRRNYENVNNVVTAITLGSTSKDDVIGKAYIGKKDGSENVIGRNNMAADYIRTLAPKITKEQSDNEEQMCNLVDVETICLMNNISGLSGLSGVTILTLYPRRFDSKRYAFYCKYRTDKSFNWAVTCDAEDDVTFLVSGLNVGDDEKAYSNYRVNTRIDDNTIESVFITIFDNASEYLHNIKIQSQASPGNLDILEIRVMPIPNYITKPAEIEKMVMTDTFRLSSNALHSIYAETTGVFRGKKFVLVGDSIAAQATYAPDIIRHTGMHFYRKIAAGGAYVRPTGKGNCIYYFVDDIPKDAEFIMFIAGQNDTGVNMQEPRLGTIDDEPFISYDKSEEVEGAATFYAAYKGMLIKTMQRCPLAKIVVCGLIPTWTLTPKGMEAYTKSKIVKNDIIKSICELYGIQFIDLIRKAGINWYNAHWMFNHDGGGAYVWPDGTAGGPTSDDDGQVHPTGLGGRRCAEVILSEII